MLANAWEWLTKTKTGRGLAALVSLLTIIGLLYAGAMVFLPKTQEKADVQLAAKEVAIGVDSNQGTIIGQQTNSPVRIDRSSKITNNYNRQVALSPAPGPTSLVRARLAGRWGEGSCNEVSYEIVIRDNALIRTPINVPEGFRGSEFVGTIISSNESSIEVRGEKPISAQGWSATLTYFSNGVIERLQWHDHASGREPVTWSRCV